MPRPRVLLTGFGPFPGVTENATMRLVPQLADAARLAFPAYAFEASVLPTEWQDAPRRAKRLYEQLEPVAAIHFGVSAKSRGFEIETRGQNRITLVSDACGFIPAASCIDPDGPRALSTKLPFGHILAQLRRHGIPASLSRDAGGYLCNALLYETLAFGRASGTNLRTGFIHIPASLANTRNQSRRPPAPTRLDWARAIEGGLIIIGSTLGLPPLSNRVHRG